MIFFLPSAIGLYSEINPTGPYWESNVKLEFIDERGLMLWAFPQVSVLWDLLSAVQYQVAGVKDFMIY